MAKWQQRALGELCLIERGGSPRPIDDYITESEDGINWIKIGDADSSMYITKTAQKIKPEGMKKSRYVQPGDFLLSNSMSFGRPYILKIDGCIHDGWLVLRDKDNHFDKRFLYFFLSAPSTYQKFKSMAVGGVVNNLNSEMVRKLIIPVPSMEVQVHIVQRLEKVDNLISKRRQQLAKLDELVKARFVEMFRGTISYCKLGDVCKLINGDRGKNYPSTKDFIEHGIPFINAGHLFDNKVSFADMNYISEEKYQALSQGRVMRNDILYCLRGSLGKHAIIDFDKAAIASSLVIIRANENKILPLFLLSVLETDSIIKQIKVANNGSSQPNLSAASVKEFIIPLPAIETQRLFALFVKQINRAKAKNHRSLEQLETLKKSLMQQYFG